MRFMAQTDPSDDSWQIDQVLRIGAAIRALRGRRSAAQISDVTAELGERVGRSTITDIEIGRRKYVAVHELSLIAAALGVPPAALLTHGSMPDGPVEFLPARTAPAHDVASWWGGGHRGAPQGTGPKTLPEPDETTAKLFNAVEWRRRLQVARIRQVVDQVPDPAVMAALREQIATVEATIRELGGVLDESGSGDAPG